VPDPRPDLQDLRGARVRRVDEDALGPAADAAADVLRRGPGALVLRGALDPAGRRGRSGPSAHAAGREPHLSTGADRASVTTERARRGLPPHAPDTRSRRPSTHVDSAG